MKLDVAAAAGSHSRSDAGGHRSLVGQGCSSRGMSAEGRAGARERKWSGSEGEIEEL